MSLKGAIYCSIYCPIPSKGNYQEGTIYVVGNETPSLMGLDLIRLLQIQVGPFSPAFVGEFLVASCQVSSDDCNTVQECTLPVLPGWVFSHFSSNIN